MSNVGRFYEDKGHVVFARHPKAADISTAILLSLLVVGLISCGASVVGGSVTTVGNQPAVSKDFCMGGCDVFGPNGRCVKFASDIADVCSRYLDRGKPSPAIYVVDSLRSVCHAPGQQGKYWEVEATGRGDVNLKFLERLPNTGAKGNIRFSRSEWEGVQRVLRKHQASDNADYRQCVRELTPLFTRHNSYNK